MENKIKNCNNRIVVDKKTGSWTQTWLLDSTLIITKQFRYRNYMFDYHYLHIMFISDFSIDFYGKYQRVDKWLNLMQQISSKQFQIKTKSVQMYREVNFHELCGSRLEINNKARRTWEIQKHSNSCLSSYWEIYVCVIVSRKQIHNRNKADNQHTMCSLMNTTPNNILCNFV